MSKILEKYKDTARVSIRLLKIYWAFEKKVFLGNLAFTLVPTFIPFLNAYIYKLLIDLLVGSISGNQINQTSIYLLLGARVITFFIQDLSYSTQTYFSNLFWTRFPIHLYQQFLSVISTVDLQHFEDSKFKNKLEKVRNSYSWKPLNHIHSIFYGFQSLIQVLFGLITIFYLNWLLIIPISIAAVIGMVIQSRVSEVAWGIWSDQSPHRKRYWYLSGLLQGGYSGESIKEVKIFQLARRFINELKDIYINFNAENTSQAKNEFRVNLSKSSLNNAAYIVIEIYIVLSALVKKITIGDLSYYTSIISNFQNGVNGLFRNLNGIYENSLYVKDMFDILDTPKILKHSTDPVKINTNKAPIIEFRNVSFKYPEAKKYVLKHFNLILEPGEKVALVGENGAGKSTIIKLLARLYDVTGGQIIINGKDIKDVDINEWHKTLGVLFQDYIKYQHSLEDNIYFGKAYSQKSESSIVEAAKKSGADLVAKTLPNKYKQMLGKTFDDGVELSNGQWQKVALGRAYLRNAPVLILDEPTASIDAKAEYEIFKKVDALSKNKTVIIISHRFSTVRNADKIFVLKKGEIEESGSHEQLLDKNGTYAKLFRLQAKGYQ